MVFEMEERSWIKAKARDYERDHRELSDAMEKAINWLATQPVGTEVTIEVLACIERLGLSMRPIRRFDI